MAVFIIRRVLVAIPLLLAISIITFAFINLAPGDPITAMINPEDRLEEHDLERLRESLGLNEPLPVRYVIWLGQAVRGNLGYSYTTREPVLDRIASRILPTLTLMAAALVISTALGILFGTISALRVYTFWDYSLSIFSLLGLSIPTFFFALVALFIFAARLEILPTFGMGDGGIVSGLYHLIMPASVLSLELTASLTRYTRSAMLEVTRADYVTTARAKGLSARVVTWRHMFRNALLPIITITSLRLPLLLGGAIIVEFMFQWPGMGLLSLQAIQQRDYPVLMGLTFMIAALVLLANLLADICYALVDPRIRVS